MRAATRRALALTVSALGAIALTASPATAASGPALVLHTEDSAGGTVTGACAFLLSASTDAANDTYYVQATAQTSGVAVSTSITCTLQTSATPGQGVLGGGGITLPGLVATTVVTVPVNRSVAVVFGCSVPDAAFLDGSTGNPNNRSTCRAL